MKFLFISDYSLKHTKGGAQRSNDLIINKGLKLGHEVTLFNYDSDLNILNENYDHIISSNLERISHSLPTVVDWLTKIPNHSRLEHDKCSYLHPHKRQALFSNCKNTFFLSEYHHHLFINSYGNYFNNVRIVLDPIDTDVFFDKHNVKENKVLNVGFMHYLKGTETFLSYAISHPEINFVMAGWGSAVYELAAKNCKNIEFLGSVAYDQMPDLYNKYTDLFYVPVVEEPFCRSVAEAKLCGMRITTNENIGCLHELARIGEDKFKYNCKNAAEQFWNHFA